LLTRVLIIDDDKILTDMLKLSLEPDSFEVTAVNSGEEGLKAARQENPDVILLDLVMPGINGWQVGKAIREFSRVPILVLSALDKPGVVTSALDGGADDFLIKPVSTDILVAHINKLARRSRAEIEASAAKAAKPPNNISKPRTQPVHYS
jgi:DNA-binding response OmpR family regulator